MDRPSAPSLSVWSSTQVVDYLLHVAPAAHRAAMRTTVPAAFLLAYFGVLSEFGRAWVSPFSPGEHAKPFQDTHRQCDWLAEQVTSNFPGALQRSGKRPESLLRELQAAGFNSKAAASFFSRIDALIPLCSTIARVAASTEGTTLTPRQFCVA